MSHSTPARALLRYAVAVLSILLAWLARAALDSWLGDVQPFATFYIAVTFVSWWADWRPGLLALALGYFTAHWFFLPPRHALALENFADVVQHVAYFFVTGTIVILMHSLRQAHARESASAAAARSKQKELESQVQQRQCAEEQLRFQLQLLQSITGAAAVCIFVTDAQGRITFMNPEAEQVFGFSCSELRGRLLHEAIHHHYPDGRPFPQSECPIGKVYESGETTRSYEEVFFRKDGSPVPVVCSNAALWIQDRLAGAVLVAQDITERKRGETALRQSEQKFRFLVENALVGVYIIQDGFFFYVNPTLAQIFGYPSAEAIISQPVSSLVAPTDRPRVAEMLRRREAREIPQAHYTFQGLRKDAVLIEVEVLGALMTYQGKPAIIGTLVDVTERKRAEQALQRRNRLLQLLHQAAADLLLGRKPIELLASMQEQIAADFGTDVFMLYQADSDNGRLHLKACSGLSPQQEQQLHKLRYGRAICAKPAEALHPIIATHLQTREGPNRRFVRKLGFHSYLYYPLLINNRLEGTLTFASRYREDFDDLDLEFFQTIARTLAEALQRQRLQCELERHSRQLEHMVDERTAKLRETIGELEGFSYSLVHDLRAPLRAMQAYASVLEEERAGELGPDGRDYLRRIKLAASRLDQLITDSLNYSRIVREELPIGPVNLGNLLRGLVETYPNLQAPQAEIQLELQDLMVLGNEAALTQVFSNLLGNAVKFVAPGVHPRVRVWAELTEDTETLPASPPPAISASFVRICVQDNGIGISKEGQEKIFGMFQRMHRTDEYPGTGVGLAIVRKSLERIGGQVAVESEPGQGSRFCVELPLAIPSTSATEFSQAV